MDALVTINKAAQELIKEEQSKGELRMNFGTYFHHEKSKRD